MKVELPPEVWTAVHAMLMEAPVPLRVSLPVMQQFERALKEAREEKPE